MSDERAPSKSPSHIAYQVRQSNEGQSHFNRVGAAWPHGDGHGFNIVLDSMPIDGRITLRTQQEQPDTQDQDEQPQRQRSRPQDRGHRR